MSENNGRDPRTQCSPDESDVLAMIKAWPGVPAIVTYTPDGQWSVSTDPADVEEYSRRSHHAPRGANGTAEEWVGSFKEEDGVLVIDETSWRKSIGGGFIEEDEAVQETLMAAKIEKAYRRLGLRHGWTFLGTSNERLYDASVAFVGLNPGGGGENDDYAYKGIWAVPERNGYFDDRWGPGETFSSVQKQVQEWHNIIEVSKDKSLCAYYVPFRSRDWASLDRKDESLALAQELWSWAVDVGNVSLFVTMGKLTARELSKLMKGRWVAQLPTGWRGQMIDVWDTVDGRRIVGMPHPSRFALLGRSENASDVAEESFRMATSGAVLKE